MIDTFLGKCFATHIISEKRMPCKFPFLYKNMTFTKCIIHYVRGEGDIAICPMKHSGIDWYRNNEYGGCDYQSCESTKGI